MDVTEYVTRDGRRPVSEWIDGLRDVRGRERILSRIDRLALGLPGDWKPIGGSLLEMRIDVGPGYRVYFAKEGRNWLSLCAAATNRASRRDIRRAYEFWEDHKARIIAGPFRVGEHLRNEREIAGYIEAVLAEGEPHLLPRALRNVADAMGGLGKLAERTGLSRETLYRTLSERGNPRYDTLFNILTAFGLRVSVVPTRPASRSHRRAA